MGDTGAGATGAADSPLASYARWASLCAAIGRSPDEMLAASRAKVTARLAGEGRR